MVRQLFDKDNTEVMEFLQIEPEFNIFIIGDIEQFGYVCDFQTIWGEFEGDELKAVLLQYRNNIVYYSEEKRSIDPFKKVLETYKFDILNGKKEVIEVFEEYLSGWDIKDMYFASLKDFKKEDIDTSEVSILDTYELHVEEYNMLATIEEFGVGRESVEEYAKHQYEISQKGARTSYYMRKDDKIVSVASVVAENSINGMIIGVATLKEYRKQGLASVVMNELCDDYLNGKGKSLCLFFDNLKAGKIYHRLGFVDVGTYRMYERKQND